MAISIKSSGKVSLRNPPARQLTASIHVAKSLLTDFIHDISESEAPYDIIVSRFSGVKIPVSNIPQPAKWR